MTGRAALGADPPPWMVGLFPRAAARDQAARAVEDQEDRAAIMEIDGGLPRSWAISLAAMCAQGPPPDMTAPEWQARLDLALRLADAYAGRLAALGWEVADLFAPCPLHGPAPPDGHGWAMARALANGGRMLDTTATRLRYDDGAGAMIAIARAG